jgi:MFS family permease
VKNEPKSEVKPFVYVAVGVAAIGGLLFGYDTGVISGAILFVKNQFSLSATMEEIVVSSVLVGAVLGAAIGGALTNRFGRRKMIILAGIIFTASAIGTALAPTVTWLIAARIVSGIAIGIASFISPMYIAELVPAKVRGSLVAVNMLAITTGIVVAYLTDYALSGIEGWRYMFGLAAIPSIILTIAMWRLPDSPRWLISKSKVEQAKRVLQRVRTESDVSAEITDIQKSMEKQGAGGMTGLFQPSLRMPLIVGLGLAVFQQITGINTVIYYAPTIFKFAGIRMQARDPGRSGVGHGDVVLSRAGHLPAGPRRPETFVINRSCRPDCRPGDLGRCFSVPAVGEFQKLHSHRRPGDLCRLLRLRTRADLLAADFRDLSLKGPRRGYERRDSNQLGNEPGGRRDIPDPGRGSGARRNLLVIRRDSDRRLGLLLSSGARNQREEP